MAMIPQVISNLTIKTKEELKIIYEKFKKYIYYNSSEYYMLRNH